MFDSILKLVIGDLKDKQAYKQMMKRVKALPRDYRYTFRKIQHYMYCVGSPDGNMTIFLDLTMFTNLINLFEASAAEGKSVIDVIGSDISKFSDEFMRASITDTDTLKNEINKEIMEKFKKEGH